MAYGDNKQQNRSIADVLSDFTKFQHDNLTNERNYNQNVLNNMATIGKYQRDIRTQNMYMKRTNATQRFLEAEQFARAETDESKLPKWLEIMNQARREIGSTTDNESGFKQEGMLRELTMDDLLSIRRMDQMEKKANGEIPTGGKPIADKIRDLGRVAHTNNSTQAVADKTNVKGNIQTDPSKLSYSNSYINSTNIDRLKKTRDVLQKSFAISADPYVAKNLANINNIIADFEFNQRDYDADEDRQMYNRWTFTDGDAMSNKILAVRQHISQLKDKASKGGFNNNPNDYANAIKESEETLNDLYDQYSSQQKHSMFQRIMHNISTWRR